MSVQLRQVLQLNTIVNADRAIVPKRLCHWTNNYNRWLSYCLRANSDVQLLWGKDSQGAMYYVSDYIIQGYGKLMTRFPVAQMQIKRLHDERKQHADSGAAAEPDSEAKTLLTRIQNQLLRETELPLQTVVAQLSGLPECACSHSSRFRKLVLWPFLQLTETSDQKRGHVQDAMPLHDIKQCKRKHWMIGKATICKMHVMSCDFRLVWLWISTIVRWSTASVTEQVRKRTNPHLRRVVAHELGANGQNQSLVMFGVFLWRCGLL